MSDGAPMTSAPTPIRPTPLRAMLPLPFALPFWPVLPATRHCWPAPTPPATPDVRPAPTRSHRCSRCPKHLATAAALHAHLRSHVNGCECPVCGKSFSRHWLLQGHIRTHTGEKPFKCPICAKAFADKSNLRAHIQTHSGRKPYSCDRCGKAFALKSYLSKHEESACFKKALKLPFLQSTRITAPNMGEQLHTDH